MPLEIIHYPHPTLYHTSKPLKRVDAELRGWVAEMFELMYEYQGVGLAANQVDLPYRLFVANPSGDPDATELEHVFLNPVLSQGKGTAEGDEGCLSIPGVTAPVLRKEKITIQAYTLRGEEICWELDDFFARVVQHETDHLDGTLFIDRLSPTQKADLLPELEEFELSYNNKQETGELPSKSEIIKRIQALEKARC